jgi:uncharacterized membrane protein YccC
LVVISGSSGSGRKRRYIHYYVCSYRHNRGATVCSNDRRERLEHLQDSVLEAIQQQVLTPERMNYVVDQAVQLIAERRAQSPNQRERIDTEMRQLRVELDRFMSVIAEGKAPTSILDEITRREDRIERLNAQLEECGDQLHINLDDRRLEELLSTQIGRFNELMTSDVPKARQALRSLLSGPILCKPDTIDGKRTLVFRGETNLGTLLQPTFITLASPRGFEPRLPP